MKSGFSNFHWASVLVLTGAIFGWPIKALADPTEATRELAGCYQPGASMEVRITAQPTSSGLVYGIEETPPAGWTVSAISGGGVYLGGVVKFGLFFDHLPRVLSYRVTPPLTETRSNISFSGVISVDGLSTAIAGNQLISPCLLPTEPLTIRAVYQNTIYTDTPLFAPDSWFSNTPAVACFSGNISAAANELAGSTNIVRPNDGTVYLTQSAIGQPVGMFTVPFNLFVQGTGTNSTEPLPELWYQLYQSVSLQATPGRYYKFSQWSDGDTSNPRTVVAGASNGYTAVFIVTNGVTLFTTNIAGTDYVTEQGKPLVFLNGDFYPHDVVVTTNGTQFSVTLVPTYTNGITRYTLDGSDPAAGTLYAGAFNVTAPFRIRTKGFTSVNTNPREADSVVSLQTSTPGGGSVAVVPQTDFFNGGASTILTATPDAGWTFLNWTGDSSSTNPTILVTNDQPRVVTAIFGTSLTLQGNGSGNISNLPAQSLYAYGATVRLTAIPAADNFFSSWGGAVSGSTSPVDFIVTNANPSVQANFANLSGGNHSLAVVSFSASGFPGGEVLKNPAANVFTNGATVALIASNYPGQSFVGWSGDASGPSTNLTVTMTNSKVIFAEFAITQPQFVLSSATYVTNQDASAVLVTIQNQGVLGSNVTFTTINGTAVAGQDFFGTNGTLTFAGGPSSQTIAIPITNQYLVQDSRSFQISLSAAPGLLGSLSNATVTVTYDYGGPQTNLLQKLPDALTTARGALRVTLSNAPPAQGGLWRFPWDISWRANDVVLTNLIPDSTEGYPIELRPFSGNTIPPVALPEGRVFANDTTWINNHHYSQISGNTSGKLTVNLGPNTGYIAANAAWRLLGETNWQSSGATLTGLAAADNYLVEFKQIPGLAGPSTRQVTVFANSESVISEYYGETNALSATAAKPLPLPGLQSIVGSVTNQPRLPYAFNGQLQSDLGFGCGVAVRPHTVLTAAHVVFNDVTLSYVDTVYWFFQKHAPELEPKPQTARGWYVMSGYAAARTNDIQVSLLNPGVSSVASRQHDVAALYFLSPAARNGFGGYLASDAETNEWLTGSSQKMLVGYPVDGSTFGFTNIIAGQMHAVTASNYVFKRAATDHVYTNADFVSFPGNSGGPVYALHSNGIYYPAGVYLGSVDGASAVRAIDSNVVNLITLAEASAFINEGDNFTGGGVTRWVTGSGNQWNPGTFQVTVSPENLPGWGWRILNGDNTNWISDNALYYPTNVAAINLEFRPVAGYITPPVTPVGLSPNQTTRIVVNYVTPPALVVTPGNGFTVSGYVGGPFSPTNITYALSNTGETNLVWTANVSSNWLSVSASGGIIVAGGSTNVQLTLSANAFLLAAGSHTNLVLFNNTSSGLGDTNYQAVLTVIAPPPLMLDGPEPLGPGSFRLQLTSTPGRDYEIQFSTNLVDWSTVIPVLVSSGTNVITNSPVSGPRQGFYRARQLP